MSNDVDRLLTRAPALEDGPLLGRVYSVVQESWLLSEDPQVVSPKMDLVASRRTALEAADLARQAAGAFRKHGFHKPSGAWWGSDGVRLHRFAVRLRPSSRNGVMLSATFAVIGAAAALFVLRGAGQPRQKTASRA